MCKVLFSYYFVDQVGTWLGTYPVSLGMPCQQRKLQWHVRARFLPSCRICITTFLYSRQHTQHNRNRWMMISQDDSFLDDTARWLFLSLTCHLLVTSPSSLSQLLLSPSLALFVTGTLCSHGHPQMTELTLMKIGSIVTLSNQYDPTRAQGFMCVRSATSQVMTIFQSLLRTTWAIKLGDNEQVIIQE